MSKPKRRKTVFFFFSTVTEVDHRSKRHQTHPSGEIGEKVFATPTNKREIKTNITVRANG